MKTKTTTYDFQKDAEGYFSNTPHPKQWFEFLGWITAFSTLKFLSEKTGSIYIKIIYYISYLILFNFIQKVVWTKNFQNYLPSRILGRTRLFVTYIVSALGVTIMYLFVSNLSEDIFKGLRL